MRTLDSDLAAALGKPTVESHLALVVDAVDTTTGAVQQLGWWTGGWTASLDDGSGPRTCKPVGKALACEDLDVRTGVEARRYRVSLVSRDDDLSVATRDLDLVSAPAKVWRVILDPADRSHQWVVPVIHGWVDEVEARAGTPDDPGGVSILVATQAEALTWSLPDRRYNQATLSRGSSSDAMFKYASIAPEVKRPW